MGLMKCPDCRCTISDDVEFCPACGKRMGTRSIYPGRPNVRAIPTYCSWCGETVPAGVRSCPGCGSPAKISYIPDGDTDKRGGIPSGTRPSGTKPGGLGKRRG